MRRLLFLAALFAGGIGASFAIVGSAASQSATWYVSGTGSDTAACSQAAPCKTFGRAYTAAGSGDTVEVLPATYPVQQFGADGNAKAVRFHCQPGGKIRQLLTRGDNLAFDGCDVDGNAQRTAGDTSLVENGGGANYHFLNGRIGNVVDEKGLLVDGLGLLIQNTLFHDVMLKTSGVHLECGYIEVPEGAVFRGNTFTNCGVMDLFFKYPDWWSPLPPAYGNVTLDGNTFGAPVGTYSVYVTVNGPACAGAQPPCGPMNGWTISNNSFGSAVQIDTRTASGNTFCGNTGAVDAAWKMPCSSSPPPPPPTTSTTTTAPAVTVTVTTTVTTTVSDCVPDAPYTSCMAEVAALRSQITALQGQLDQAGADKKALQDQIDVLKTRLAQINSLSAP